MRPHWSSELPPPGPPSLKMLDFGFLGLPSLLSAVPAGPAQEGGLSQTGTVCMLRPPGIGTIKLRPKGKGLERGLPESC